MINKNMKDKDMEMWKLAMEKVLKTRYKKKILDTIEESLSDLGLFIVICLAIVFRPLNLLIGGLITIAIIVIMGLI